MGSQADEGRWSFSQWYLQRQEKLGKVETQKVVQSVWSIECYTGLVGNKGTYIPCLILNIQLRCLYSIQLTVGRHQKLLNRDVLQKELCTSRLVQPSFKKGRSQKPVAVSIRHLDQALSHKNLDCSGTWIEKEGMVGR